MKTKIFLFSVILAVSFACSPSQRVTSSYLNKEAIPKSPYKKIFVAALTKDMEAKKNIELKFADLIGGNGGSSVLSFELFAPNYEAFANAGREEIMKKIKDAGCDGIITIALLDVLEKQRYEPGVVYGSGLPYGFYGSFYGYYSFRYPSVYAPGYYTTDKTFLIETNIYDVANESLLWTVQSKASNPSGFDSWFKGYVKLLFKQMEEDGLVRK